MRPVAASRTPSAAGRVSDRHIDHIHMNVGVWMVSVSVSAGSGVTLRFFQILFLNNLLAFDHAASAVGTVVLALFTAGSAAGAVFIVFNLCTGNLFAVFRTF